MRKSDLLDRLQEIEGDPEVFINTFGDHCVLIGNIYVDDEGDIVIET